MDISNYNLKNTTKCECGHQFDIHEINGLINIDNHGFFSNIVKTCSLVHCPNCNKETVLFLKQKGQTWEVLALGVQDSIEKNNEFVCPTCQREFKSKIGLTSHMRTHNN